MGRWGALGLWGLLAWTSPGCAAGTQQSAWVRVRSAETDRSEALCAQGERLTVTGNYEAALQPFADAAVLAQRQRARLLAARALAGQAKVLVFLARGAEARAVVAQALELVGPGTLREDTLVFKLQVAAAESYRRENQQALAVPAFEAAIVALERHSAVRRKDLLDVLLRLVDTQVELGRMQDAGATTERLRRAFDAGPAAARHPEDVTYLAAAHLRVGQLDEVQLLAHRHLAVIRRWEGGVVVDVDFATGLEARGLFAKPTAPAQVAANQPTAAPPAAPPSPEPTQSAAAFPDDAPASVPTPAAPAASPAPVAAPSPETGSYVADAAPKVAQMRAAFRTCYQRELAQNRKALGTVSLMLSVGSNGRVERIDSLSFGISRVMVDCLLARASATVFSRPTGGRAKIRVPVTFLRQ